MLLLKLACCKTTDKNNQHHRGIHVTARSFPQKYEEDRFRAQYTETEIVREILPPSNTLEVEGFLTISGTGFPINIWKLFYAVCLTCSYRSLPQKNIEHTKHIPFCTVCIHLTVMRFTYFFCSNPNRSKHSQGQKHLDDGLTQSEGQNDQQLSLCFCLHTTIEVRAHAHAECI